MARGKLDAFKGQIATIVPDWLALYRAAGYSLEALPPEQRQIVTEGLKQRGVEIEPARCRA
jgi:hypothetical protein